MLQIGSDKQATLKFRPSARILVSALLKGEKKHTRSESVATASNWVSTDD